MKYNYKDYEAPLSDEMKEVEVAYKKYILNKEDKTLYDKLKETVYSLSLTIKMARSCGYLTATTLDEMNEYYWGLLL